MQKINAPGCDRRVLELRFRGCAHNCRDAEAWSKLFALQWVRVQNMKQLGGAIKQIVGRGPNAVALREFHRRLNSGVRLRIALRWAFNFELRPAGGRIMTRNAASLRRCCVFCLFCGRARTRSLSLFLRNRSPHQAYFSYWHVNGFDAGTKESIRSNARRDG